MKKFFLIIALALSSYFLSAQIQQSYMIPDIGSPGMNIYIEIIASVDSHWFFGEERVVDDLSLYLRTKNSADNGKIDFSPLYVSWAGRLISAQIFVHPDLKPSSWKWNEGIHIPIELMQAGKSIGDYDFYVVQPFHIGNADASKGFVFGVGGEDGLGIRSPRGAMIIDSMISTSEIIYTVSKGDCDTKTPGNQGYLPFNIISVGRFEVPKISVDADTKNGGVGGGGGGGSVEDDFILSGNGNVDAEDLKGGDGFTGGGIGKVNHANPLHSRKGEVSSKGGGVGSGSVDNSKTSPWVAGSSLNGVQGAKTISNIYESTGGGTGHPFGRSGEEYQIDAQNNFGYYGGGSGAGQNTAGGNGCYASSTNKKNDGNQHGNPYIIPLAGGSGGGGGNPQGWTIRVRSGYGGGGGGAIAISATTIKIDTISANGAKGANYSGGDIITTHHSDGGYGSGGAVILNGDFIDVKKVKTECGDKSVENSTGYFRYSDTRFDILPPLAPSSMKQSSISRFGPALKYADKTKTFQCQVTNINSERNTLYAKSENSGEWKEVPKTPGMVEDVNIEPDFWDHPTDSVYYFYMVEQSILLYSP